MTATQNKMTFPMPLTDEGCPDPLLRSVTAESPVLRVKGPGGIDTWLVAGYDVARDVLNDSVTFSSAPPDSVEDQRASFVPLVGMDPPDHTRLRKLTLRAFAPGRIKAMQPTIDRIAASLTDEFEAAGKPADLVDTIAYPLPIKVIFGMLGGIPDDVQAKVHQWTDTFISLDSSTAEEISEALEGYQGFVSDLVAERREHLGDDLISDLIRTRDETSALSEEELTGLVGILIVAGYETTAKVISRGVMSLIHFGVWRDIAAGRFDLHNVVEEVLRHQAPNTAIHRHAKKDVRLNGHHIKAGELVLVSTHLANYDRTTHDQPELLDLERKSASHITFGYGAHACIGMALARAELVTIIGVLAKRLPHLSLACSLDELTWTSGSWLNAPTHLPLTW